MLGQGVITALITPFKNGKIDREGLRENVRFQVEQGVDGLLAIGTTGETATLSPQEKEEVVVTILEEAKGKIPVIVATGDNATERAVENTKWAKGLGADAALVIVPYYNRPSQEGIFCHFEAIATQVDFPILIYNIPKRTGVDMELETIKRISRFPSVVGIKEASSRIERVGDLIHFVKESKNFSVFSGDDAITYPLLTLGGDGVISAISNLVPHIVKRMVHAAIDGDFLQAREDHFRLLPLFKLVSCEVNPVPIKTMMTLLGRPAGSCRLPLCPLREENREKIIAFLQKEQLT